jgi:hypothetical protein
MAEIFFERERSHRDIYRKVDRATETLGLERFGFDLGVCHHVSEEYGDVSSWC